MPATRTSRVTHSQQTTSNSANNQTPPSVFNLQNVRTNGTHPAPIPQPTHNPTTTLMRPTPVCTRHPY